MELSWHRKAVTMAAMQQMPSGPIHSGSVPSSSPLPESSPPPTDIEDALPSAMGLSCTRVSLKRSNGSVLEKSNSLSSVVSISTTVSESSDAPPPAVFASKSKKLKHSQAASDVQHEPTIIDIDDIEDPQEERLNKSYPTADIKYFFTPIPCLSGQAKCCMRCNLCR